MRLLGALVLLLAGCPAAPPDGPAVAVGRVWRFTVAAGPGVEQTQEVVSVGRDEVVVRVQTHIHGAPVGDPVLVPFPLQPWPAARAGAPAEPLVVPGAPPLAAWVVPGPVTSTLAGEAGRLAFPGPVRVEADGAPRFVLRRVD